MNTAEERLVEQAIAHRFCRGLPVTVAGVKATLTEAGEGAGIGPAQIERVLTRTVRAWMQQVAPACLEGGNVVNATQLSEMACHTFNAYTRTGEVPAQYTDWAADIAAWYEQQGSAAAGEGEMLCTYCLRFVPKEQATPVGVSGTGAGDDELASAAVKALKEGFHTEEEEA